MHKMPVNDFMTKNGKVRVDGQVVRDMYLMQAKTPEESKGEWDLVKRVATVPGDDAFRPLERKRLPAREVVSCAGGAPLQRRVFSCSFGPRKSMTRHWSGAPQRKTLSPKAASGPARRRVSTRA